MKVLEILNWLKELLSNKLLLILLAILIGLSLGYFTGKDIKQLTGQLIEHVNIKIDY